THFVNKVSLRTAAYFEKLKLTEHTFMIIVAIIIGVLAGFSAIGIRFLIKEISALSFQGEGNILENIMNTSWYWILIIPAIGGIIVGPIIYFLAPEAKGHGVPEVMQALLLKGGNIRARVAFIKTIASSISIGTGGSVGREGPIIQIGSSLGSMIGQFLRVPSKRLKTLVGCGAAAGIAAAFNAPIAGALFAVEIILMDFAIAQFSPIVIASVMATVVSHTFTGKFAAFEVPKYQLVSPQEIGLYFVLGALAGVVSYLFIKLLYWCEDLFDNKMKLPEYVNPAIGGLLVGAIALFFPQVMGVGYDTINVALYGKMVWYVAVALIFAKILATSVTLGSGGSGGIFAPSLFMGAMLGYFFGYVVHSLFPNITATPGAYALVAMGGLVAGTTRAPITAIIIVFELTNDYSIILPLMVTCIISLILSSRLTRESIYTLKLLLRNIGIKEGMEVNVMESLFVKELVRTDVDAIADSENFNQVVNKILKGKSPELPVVDRNNIVKGVISIYDVKDHFFEKEELKNLLIAADIANTNFETLPVESNCQVALDKMSRYDLEGLPVVSEEDGNRFLGYIWRKDIQDAYQKEIERMELASNIASSIVMKEDEKEVHFMEGYSIVEISPPKSFIGKSIRELDIRKNFGVDVLSIRTGKKSDAKIKAIPNPNHIFKEDQTIIIAGEIKKINLLRNL
ncbi:MAG: chloride channel protein, partial [Ignavibacteriaceae bacterium]